MAGALGLKLGGPRRYGDSEVFGATLGSGRLEATAKDLRRALALYLRALAAMWAAVGIGAAAMAC
jgi:adenosylcobinamide-phosphate synthase